MILNSPLNIVRYQNMSANVHTA